MRVFLFLLALTATASAQQPTPIEQRLGATIGALIVENSRIVVELESAKQTISQLRAELERLKDERK